jgi:hypothetical protein
LFLFLSSPLLLFCFSCLRISYHPTYWIAWENPAQNSILYR